MSIFTDAIDAALKVAGAIGRKANVAEVIGHVIGALPKVLHTWNGYKESDARSRITEVWAEFDIRTGLGGLDLVRSMPPEAEERLFDGVKAIGLELSLWAAGAYGDRPSGGEIDRVSSSIIDALGVTTIIPENEAPLPEQGANDARDSRSQITRHLANPGKFTIAAQVEALQEAAILVLSHV